MYQGFEPQPNGRGERAKGKSGEGSLEAQKLVRVDEMVRPSDRVRRRRLCPSILGVFLAKPADNSTDFGGGSPISRHIGGERSISEPAAGARWAGRSFCNRCSGYV